VRKFNLRRIEDETGISGTGIVTEGYQWERTGICVMKWLSDKSSVAVYASIEDVEAIHGHNGKTVVEWGEQVRIAPDWVTDPVGFYEDRALDSKG
jgi:hypothetical protein